MDGGPFSRDRLARGPAPSLHDQAAKVGVGQPVMAAAAYRPTFTCTVRSQKRSALHLGMETAVNLKQMPTMTPDVDS
jgi:hypothetical protein